MASMQQDMMGPGIILPVNISVISERINALEEEREEYASLGGWPDLRFGRSPTSYCLSQRHPCSFLGDQCCLVSHESDMKHLPVTPCVLCDYIIKKKKDLKFNDVPVKFDGISTRLL